MNVSPTQALARRSQTVRSVAICIYAGLALLGFLLCSSCKKTDEHLLIGEYASLSGTTATFGQSMDEGVRLALEELNQAGGLLNRQVKIVVEDDQSRPEEAKTAALKLIKRDKVVALIGEVASSRSLAAAPEAQKNGVPMISPASTNPRVTQIGDYIFRACFIDTFQGSTMARFAYQDLGLRQVAIFYDIKNDYSVGLAEFFEKTFQELGGTIVDKKSYAEGDIEFRAQLTALKNHAPQGLFIPGYYTEVGLIAKQARELGLNAPLLGVDGWDSAKTLEIGGAALEGSYYSNHYSADDPSPIVQNFIAKYRKKYSKIPDAMAVLGYDAANLLFDAIRRAQTADRKAIREALASTKNFQGVSGSITIDEQRNASKKIVILKIENGQTKFYRSLEP